MKGGAESFFPAPATKCFFFFSFLLTHALTTPCFPFTLLSSASWESLWGGWKPTKPEMALIWQGCGMLTCSWPPSGFFHPSLCIFCLSPVTLGVPLFLESWALLEEGHKKEIKRKGKRVARWTTVEGCGRKERWEEREVASRCKRGDSTGRRAKKKTGQKKKKEGSTQSKWCADHSLRHFLLYCDVSSVRRGGGKHTSEAIFSFHV